jgi:NAD(P)-dependent dehydrogenase (short-subunit alcohol dehydrogenase family)
VVVPTDAGAHRSRRCSQLRWRRSGVSTCCSTTRACSALGRVGEIDDEQWHATWRTNVDGALFCVAKLSAHVGASAKGGIINNGSLSAHRPRPAVWRSRH